MPALSIRRRERYAAFMQSFLLARLPDRATILQFLRFGVVGGLGFLVDTGTVYLLRGPLGLYWAGALAYPVAASFTWAVNRFWTFRGQGAGSAGAQWVRFLAANLLGFALNRGTYFLMITISAICAAHPVIAVAAGAGAGMFVNFDLSRRLVFR
jgi:putative flippase GtrA